jgi:sec-independent protein translocase protein TatA
VVIVFSNIGTTELLIIAILMLFLFGGKKLPELSKGVADSVREFRKATKE